MERFVTLTPSGEDRQRVAVLIEEARGKSEPAGDSLESGAITQR
jgi:hypothetical protein